MVATIVDLRYKMKDVLKALSRNEKVRILYHGKEVGVIVPTQKKKKPKRVQDHPFFGRRKDDPRTVEEVMEELRRPRYRDI